MSRLLCSLMLAFSVALLAFGPTAVLAAPSCDVFDCFHGNSNNQIKSGDTCDNGCSQPKPGHDFHTVPKSK
jgi:hypothetical protein